MLAFFCLVFVTNAIHAQAITGTVDANGLIKVDESIGWQDEYVINISQFHFTSYKEAADYFQKYVTAFNVYGQFTFDIQNQRLYMKIQRENSVHIGNMTPQSLNNALLVVYRG
jgi:hypothetical protein